MVGFFSSEEAGDQNPNDEFELHFRDVALQFSSDSHVTVTRLTAPPLPEGIEIELFPSVVLYPATAKDSPQWYEGKLTGDRVGQFVEMGLTYDPDDVVRDGSGESKGDDDEDDEASVDWVALAKKAAAIKVAKGGQK